MCIMIIQYLIKHIWDVTVWRLIPLSMQTVKQRARKVFFPQKCMRPLVYLSYSEILFTDRSAVVSVKKHERYEFLVLYQLTPQSMCSVLCDCKVQQSSVLVSLVHWLSHTNKCTVICCTSVKFTLQTFKSSYMFRSSDHLQGATMFLAKVIC